MTSDLAPRAVANTMSDVREGDVTLLSDTLSALASPPRLALLRLLRTPRTLGEIKLGAEPGAEGASLMSRQAVRRHLDTLIAAGLVAARPAERGYGETMEYVVNHQRAFLLAEEVRALARLRPVVEPGGATMQGASRSPVPAFRPILVVVKGLEEGRWFDLRPRPQAPSAWVLGRSRDADIVLDFDPLISGRNSLLESDGPHHRLSTLPSSRNGTFHNFRLLEEGERVRLRHGDLVGAGLTLLTYWTEAPGRP